MTVRVLKLDDLRFVYDVMLDDDVFPHICDDGTDNKNSFARLLPALLNNANNIFLSPGPGCVFMLCPLCTGCYDVHTCITPEYRGKIAIEYGKASIGFCFENLVIHKLVSHIPEYNRRALLYALRCGFKREGKIRSMWYRHGILYDVDIVGTNGGSA